MPPNIEEQATTPATATAREPRSNKKANVAPQKPRVAPAKDTSGKSQEDAQKRQVGQTRQEGWRRPRGRTAHLRATGPNVPLDHQTNTGLVVGENFAEPLGRSVGVCEKP